MRNFLLNVIEYFLELIYSVFTFLQYACVIVLLLALIVGPVTLGVIYSPLWSCLYVITIPIARAIFDELD